MQHNIVVTEVVHAAAAPCAYSHVSWCPWLVYLLLQAAIAPAWPLCSFFLSFLEPLFSPHAATCGVLGSVLSSLFSALTL
jgi:hypothetical protein